MELKEEEEEVEKKSIGKKRGINTQNTAIIHSLLHINIHLSISPF